MNRKCMPVAAAAVLAPMAVWGLSVEDAAREVGGAEVRYEYCLRSGAASCGSMLQALMKASEALGAAKATASPAEIKPAAAEPSKGIEAQVSELLEGARAVQTKMDKLRETRKTLYDTMDKARDVAMGVNVGSPHGPEAIETAQTMPETVEHIYDQIEKAQKDANKAVQQALELRRCSSAGALKCESRENIYATGKDALDKVTKAEADVKKEVAELRKGALDINATEAGLAEDQRKAYRKFEEGLQGLPGARSLLGGDFVGLVASKEDSLVALQVGYDIKQGLLGRNRVSFHMTAPLGAGSKRGSLFDNLNGQSDEGSFGVGYGMARANPLGTGLYRAMFGATVSRKNYDYLTTSDTTVTEIKQKLKPWRLGVEVEYALLGAAGQQPNTAHRLALYHERKFKEGDAGIFCPGSASTTAVTCHSGAIGAPKKIQGTTVSYAYHYRFDDGKAMAPRLTYDSATKTSGLDVPFYLITSKDKSTELNAGIVVGWARKPAKDSTPAQSEFNFGLFVGAPFGLLGGGINSR
jgi:hypothetical protein